MDALDGVGKARQYEEEQAWSEALDTYQQALTLNPQHANTHNDLGTFYEQLGRLDEAEQHYRSAVQLDPDTIYLYNLGMLYEKQGRLDEAQVEFERLLSLADDPQDVSKAKALLEKVSGLSFEKCNRCGCISILGHLFKSRWEQVLCPRCYAQPRFGSSGSTLGCFLAVVAGVGVAVLSYGNSSFYLMTNLVSIVILNYLLAFPHEFAHAAVGRLLGGKIFEIRVGIGQILWEKTIGDADFSIRRRPAMGACIIAFPTREFILERIFLAVAAGPLLNISLLLLFLLLLLPGLDWSRLWSAYAWRETLLIANGIFVLFSLIPQRVHLGVTRSLTDGGQLLRLAFGKQSRDVAHSTYFLLAGSYAFKRQKYPQAIELCQAGLTLYPNDILLRNVQAVAMLEAEQHKEALTALEELLARFQNGETTEQIGVADENRALVEATLLNNVAWELLCASPSPVALKQAYDYAQEAFRMTPWLAYIQGTWGSVLIETGSLQEGIQHVLEAYEHSEISRSQATNLAYAAIGYHRLGEAEKATELFQKALSLDESVYSVKKARAELGLSNGSESLTKTASSTA